MKSTDLNWIANFIWGIADDCFRGLYVRGKYRDAVGIADQDQALRQAAGQAFYNKSTFPLRGFRNRASQQALRADFEAYLDGFSLNVQEIPEADGLADDLAEDDAA